MNLLLFHWELFDGEIDEFDHDSNVKYDVLGLFVEFQLGKSHAFLQTLMHSLLVILVRIEVEIDTSEHSCTLI